LFPARPTGYVTDAAGIVDPAAKAQMESLISRLREATGAEIAVVTLPTLGDRDESEVALAILRTWRVGRKAEIGDSTRNAGLVLLLVPRQEGKPGSGAIRVEVGYGLEGIVTDAGAGRVRDLMLPAAREGDYGRSIDVGVRALVSMVARGYGVSDSSLTTASPYESQPNSPGIPWWLPLLFFLVFFMLSRSFGGRRSRVYWGGGPWVGGGLGWGGWWGGWWFGGGGGVWGFRGWWWRGWRRRRRTVLMNAA